MKLNSRYQRALIQFTEAMKKLVSFDYGQKGSGNDRKEKTL